MGTAYIKFEHTPYDGATVVRMLEDLWHEAADTRSRVGGQTHTERSQPPTWLEKYTGHAFELTAQSEAAVQHATVKSTQFASITKFKLLDIQMKHWRMSPDGCY